MDWVRNHNFQSFFGHQRAEIWTWSKIKSFLKTHPISIHTKLEEDSVNRCPDNGRKPLFSVIFWPPGAEIWPTWPKIESSLKTHIMSVGTKFEEDAVNSCPDNCWKPPFSVIFWPPGGRNLANVAENRIISEDSHNECRHQV